MIEKRIYDKAEKLICSLNDGVLTSVSEDGCPRSCFIGIIGHDNPWTMYFSTGRNGTKARHFSTNKKASVAYADIAKNNGITLMGEVEIVEDIEVKKRLWSDWMIEYFPKGAEDENFFLIKFIGSEVTYWIDHEFGTEKID